MCVKVLVCCSLSLLGEEMVMDEEDDYAFHSIQLFL